MAPQLANALSAFELYAISKSNEYCETHYLFVDMAQLIVVKK